MNLNQFVNMVTRTLMHRLVNIGVNKGVDMMAGSGRSGRSGGAADKPSPDAARKEKRAREAARQAQRAIRNLRRFGR